MEIAGRLGSQTTVTSLGKGTIFDNYYSKITKEIWQQWVFPDTGLKDLEAIVSIRIMKDGTITAQKIERSSGNSLFDRSVIKALVKASPLSPPPYEMEIGDEVLSMKTSKELSAKNEEQKGKSKIFRSVFLTLCYLLYALCMILCVEAKVYIDISSPGIKKLPIAIQGFSGTSGKKISDIIRNDLEFTGLFVYIDKSAYLENPSQPFDPKNCTPIGVESVVKGSVQEGKDFSVKMSLYDVLRKRDIKKRI